MNKPMDDKARPEAWPDWKLERYLLGELPPDSAAGLEARLGSDPDLARRLSALRSEHAALRAAHPTADMAAGIARRLRLSDPAAAPSRQAAPAAGPAGSRPRPGAAASLAAAVAAVFRRPALPVLGPAFAMLLALAVLPFTSISPFRSHPAGEAPGGEAPGGEAPGGGAPAGERLKGLEPRLILHRKLAHGSLKLSSGEAARAGDVIQIQYESAGFSQGALYSLDADGKVTRHFPDRGPRSAALRAGGPVALDFAYELDDAAGWERFYFITASRPFDLEAVEAALRRAHPADAKRADPLPLPKDLGQCQFILLKEPGT